MANRFSQIFTLADIFNNKNLQNKLPLVNYEETEKNNDETAVKTDIKIVNNQIFNTAKTAARPFYKSMTVSQGGDKLIISGDLVGNQDATVDAVYNALLAQKSIIIWAANNGDIIRSALKEAKRNKRQNGINSKLYLRVQSMQQIEGMSKREIQALMSDIMENIVYGDDFPQTQKKYNVESLSVNSPYNYKQRQLRWKYKVGDV